MGTQGIGGVRKPLSLVASCHSVNTCRPDSLSYSQVPLGSCRPDSLSYTQNPCFACRPDSLSYSQGFSLISCRPGSLPYAQVLPSALGASSWASNTLRRLVRIC